MKQGIFFSPSLKRPDITKENNNFRSNYMKRLMISGALLSLMACNAAADVTLKLVPKSGVKQVEVTSVLISNMMTARTPADLKEHKETVAVKGKETKFKLDEDGAARYDISLSEDKHVGFFAAPGENLTVNVTSMQPFTYTVSGTPLMDGITELDAKLDPIAKEYNTLQSEGKMNEETHKRLVSAYNAAAKEFFASHKDSSAGAYAMTKLEGDDFLAAYKELGAKAKESIFFPFVENQYKAIERQQEQEAKQKAMQSGDVDAPAFTLKDINGKDVSLSDFRGKWVVLDFWGAWCKWCIKGFPALKEAYASGKFEVIGVDNRDSVEDWKAAVERFKLPWVNVYNPADTGQELLSAYGVSGFPTKVIVSPEGKIANITVGEDPEFFNILNKLIGE